MITNVISANNILVPGQSQSAPADVKYFDGGGSLLPALFTTVFELIFEAAKRLGKDVSWLNPNDSFEERKAKARANGFEIGAAYARCSTDMQDSYLAQITSCIDRALANCVIIFPELIAGDEAISGKRTKRVGLDLVKEWAAAKAMSVLIAFSVNRMFRRLPKGLQFIREDIMERGIRVLAVAENLDSSSPLFGINLNFNMLFAEAQANGIPEFVRMGQKTCFSNGFLIGACNAGYRPVPVPEAGLTKKGKPKTKPQIVPEVAAIIVQAFEWILQGITIAAACRMYNKAINMLPPELRQYALDSRGTDAMMGPSAFRKLLSNDRLRGVWSFGKKRNKFLDSKDTTIQVDGPEHEVVTVVNEDLRIVPDELFYAVQAKLAENNRGKHGPRTGKEATLATTLNNMYVCAECGHPLTYYSLQYMHCPETVKGTCSNCGTVHREQALAAVLAELRKLVPANEGLVAEIVRQAKELDAAMDDGRVHEQIAGLEQVIAKASNAMRLMEADGSVDPEDMERYRALKRERAKAQAEVKCLQAQLANKPAPVTEEEITKHLAEIDALLLEAGEGNLSGDSKAEAGGLIRALVGGKVTVTMEKDGNGKRAFGKGTFTPNIALALSHRIDLHGGIAIPAEPITVSFREKPRIARFADEAYRLRTEEKLSFTEIGKRLGIGSGNAYSAYAHWYQVRGLEVPREREEYAKRKPA